MRNVSLLTTLCLLISMTWGCGPTPKKNSASSSATTSSPRRVIGASLLTLQNPFFQVIGDSMREEAAKHGFDVVVQSADEDVVKQGVQVKDFIVNGVAAIVLSPCQVDAIGPVIREANAAGIPVFTVDIPSRLPDVKIECQVASDNYGGGKQAAAAMIQALGSEGGKVAILHFAQAESCQLRVRGFRDAIEQHNQVSKARIEIVAELEGGGAKDRGAKTTEDLLQTFPDLQGIFAINDPSALGAVATLEKVNKLAQVRVIGFDGQPDGKQAIRDGKIYGDPVQFPDRMGVEVVQAIVKHSQGEAVAPEILIPTQFFQRADAEHEAAQQ